MLKKINYYVHSIITITNGLVLKQQLQLQVMITVINYITITFTTSLLYCKLKV